MGQFIARCLAWVGALLIPRATGRHRAAPAAHICTCRVRTVLVWPANPPRLLRRPRHVDRPIDGDRSPLVRPYYAAYEEEERRWDAELFGYEVAS